MGARILLKCPYMLGQSLLGSEPSQSVAACPLPLLASMLPSIEPEGGGAGGMGWWLWLARRSRGEKQQQLQLAGGGGEKAVQIRPAGRRASREAVAASTGGWEEKQWCSFSQPVGRQAKK